MLNKLTFHTIGFAFAFLTLMSTSVLCVTFTVTKTADTNDGVCDADCSLREAIAVANTAATDDTIAFDPAVFGTAQIITINNLNGGGLIISNNGSLTVNGPGRQLLTINGNNNTIVFNINGDASGGANASISGITITGGNPGFLTLGRLTLTDVAITGNGGGIINDVGPLTINNSIISNNTSNLGGGIQSRFTGNSIHPSVVINDSIISNNLSTGSGGGISNPQTGSITINNTVVSGNMAAAGGGIVNSGTLILNNSHVDQNTSTSTASDAGGGIQNVFGTLTANSGSTISGNVSSSAGGGINNDEGSINLTSSVISGNSSTGDGGGIYSSLGTVTLSAVNVNNNSVCSSCRGGGIYQSGAALTIDNSSFTSNSAASGGGVVYQSGTSGNISNSSFSSNAANNGTGGGIVNGGTLVLTNVVFDSNRAATTTNFSGGQGAGFFNSGSLTATGVTLKGNTATRTGGGFTNDIGSVSLTNTTVSNNSADTAGGYCNGCGDGHAGGVVTLTNVTISGNAATGIGTGGGGISNGNFNTSNLTNVSVVRNAADRFSGVLNSSQGTLKAINSIFADNVSQNGIAPDFQGTLTSQGHNLVGNISGITITGTTTGNIIGRDPQLVLLRNNGGATDTVALQPSSPAIDAGDPNNFPSTDQRGVPRAQDGDLNGSALPDIGAYERKLTLFTVTKVADTNDENCDADCSLREALSAAVGSTSKDNAVVFTSPLFDQAQLIVLAGGDLTVSGPNTLLIAGPGPDLLTISGNHVSRVLTFNTGSIAGIRGVNITAGNGSSANLPDWGGGVLTRESSVTIDHCSLRDNTTSNSSGSGGGVYNFRGTLRLSSSTVSGSVGWNGGGVVNTNFGGVLEVSDSFISNNTAGMGSGIYNQGAATIVNSTINDNTSQGGCTGILGGQSLIVVNSLIKGNHATGNSNGGGVCAGESGSISGSRIENNSAGSGGGLVMGDSFVLINSTVTNNVASGRGGGIMTGQGNGLTTIINSIITGNRAGDLGGGIQCSMPMKVTNSTISYNSSAGNFGFGGGGIFVELPSGGNVDFVNSTIAFNDARIGGGVHNNSGTVTAKNSIIARNFSSGTGPDFQGILSSLGYNLVQDINGLTITGTTTGNILGLDPLLDPIVRMNGGPTATHALRKNSPAIDKGASTTPAMATDQRGFIRPIDLSAIPNAPGGNGSDIGAFEEQLTEVVVPPVLFDFDDDGKTDIGITRPNSGVIEWWISRSSDSNVFATVFGVTGDIPAPGYFTGDGKTDIAMFRPSNGNWFVLRSEDFTFFAFPFGANGDIPMPADFDGDGKTDPAVFRPSSSTWFIARTSDNQTTIAQFGAAGDQPVAADYDGDGKADIAIYRQNNGAEEWWIQRSSAGLFATVFGAAGDKAVPGDYTGDGKADVAVWRPSNGNWFILRSEDLSFFAFPWGANGDIPAPGDYDGDGKTDAAVFRQSSATWFINRTGGAGPLITGFGAATDSPVAGAFIR